MESGTRNSDFGFWKLQDKDLLYRGHNPSHSTLYPDVLNIKTIIVVKCHLFINYKFTNPFLATLQLGTSWQQGGQIMGL